MQNKPEVSVLMPFYDDGTVDARREFTEAMDGLLAQTFDNFEVVLVVSGEQEFSKTQAARSGKIHLFFFNQEKYDYRKIPLQEKVKGIVTAWNLCVSHSKGALLAFQASDDISHPNRLAVQTAFMNARPHICGVGSAMTMIDGAGKEIGLRKALETDKQIRNRMLQFNPIPSPSLMVRAQSLKAAGGFSVNDIPEDYDLWVRMAVSGQFYNLQTPLVKYRIHPRGGVSIYRLPLYIGSLKVKMKAMKLLGLKPRIGDILVNILQFCSLFFPDGIRRVVLEKIRGKVLIGGN